ncbi:MAG TPA: FtsX-like permease family protein, partial [Opitutaceae bacterium]
VVLRSDARGSVGSLSRHRMLRGLIIAQVAVAFILANGAVLFARGYMKLMQENQLLATDRVVSARVALSGPRYGDDASQVRLWYELVRRVEGLSGVTSAAVTSKLPLEGGSNTNALVNDETYDPTIPRLQVERSSVTENYFETMGLRLLQGRNLKPEDREGEVRGVVVNKEMVARAWPNKDPLGQIMRGNNPGKPWYTVRVVGVVENVKQWGADAPMQAEMYTTPEGHWGDSAMLVVRTSLPLAKLTPMLRHELAQIDGELAFRDVRTMRQVVERSTQSHRAVTGLVNFFMAVALGLVAVGLYGTLSYHVQQRTREIGVRVAIGAMKRDIFRLIFTQGGRWILIGMVFGLLGSFAVSKLLKAIVYGMSELTALPLVFAAIAVVVAALAACWLPAHRAARLDPLEALRAD